MLTKRLAIDKLGRDESDIPNCPDLVNRENVRMIQARSCLRFLNESLETMLIRREGLGQNLDRNGAIKFSILRPIPLAHPAFADLGNNAIVREIRAGGKFCHL